MVSLQSRPQMTFRTLKVRIKVPQVHNNPNECLDDMVRFCTTSTFCIELNKDQRKILALRSQCFKVMGDKLYDLGAVGNFHRCVQHSEQRNCILEAHQHISRGHFSREVIAQKIWQVGLWWSTVSKDATKFAKKNVTYVNNWDNQRSNSDASSTYLSFRTF